MFGLGWAEKHRLVVDPHLFELLEGSKLGRRGFFFGLNFRQPSVRVLAIDSGVPALAG